MAWRQNNGIAASAAIMAWQRQWHHGQRQHESGSEYGVMRMEHQHGNMAWQRNNGVSNKGKRRKKISMA
jgi:hypothetical protein